jgi:Tfp pilus assembly protein PilF
MDPPLMPLSIHEQAGGFYLQRGDAAAAKAAFQQALLQRPRSGYIMLGLARAENSLRMAPRTIRRNSPGTASSNAFLRVIQISPR